MAATRLALATKAFLLPGAGDGAPGQEPRLFFAPGRANLLGAHLDYNGGCVVPVALSKGTYGAFGLRSDGRLRVRSAQFPNQSVDLALSELRPGRARVWSAYLEGAVYFAARSWGGLEGLEVALSADLPIARGLSSSASVTTLAVYALARLLEAPASEDEMARLAVRAESEYVGVRCGMLDPAAILFARENSALLFDCLHHTREHLPLDPRQAWVGVMDSGVRRELAGSAFNQRVAECTRALAILQETHPGLTCLREVRRAQFEASLDRLPPVLQRRVRHVVSEVERTDAGARALARNNLALFGSAISASHDSLRDNYEVSTPELDALCDAARAQQACYGARLTGAGFGGCVVALVHPDGREEFARGVVEGYRQASGRPTAVDWFRPSGGPHELQGV